MAIKSRIADLERCFPSWCAPEGNSRWPSEDETQQKVLEEAMHHLTTVELAVLQGLQEMIQAHPNVVGVQLWKMMSEPQKELESQWRWIVLRVLRDRIEETDETRERKEELKRRADEAVRMGVFPEEVVFEHQTPS